MDLKSLESEALKDLEQVKTLSDIDAVYTKYLGRKDGELTRVLRHLGDLTPEEKKETGRAANVLKNFIEEKIQTKQKSLQASFQTFQIESQKIDLTLPGTPYQRGHSHPILQAIQEICQIFQTLGFDVVEGPEVETDQNNFSDLNIPDNHPAKDLHDTFYVKLKEESGKPYLLRTHTSPVQIRLMKEVKKPPIRVVAPGRVYRHEATDATHAAIFHQVEGLAVDANITFADLKGTLEYFAKHYFDAETKVRFSPSYFPFVEPGAEMSVLCFGCRGTKKKDNGDPCSLCKGSGWIEMLGAGMVHPQVLRNVGIDPEKNTGFAFGMGVERIIMTRLGVDNIRTFLESDLRFLEQFS